MSFLLAERCAAVCRIISGPRRLLWYYMPVCCGDIGKVRRCNEYTMEKEQLGPTSDGGASVCTAVPVCDRYPQAEL